MLSAFDTFLTMVVKMSLLLDVVCACMLTLMHVIGNDCFSKISAYSANRPSSNLRTSAVMMGASMFQTDEALVAVKSPMLGTAIGSRGSDTKVNSMTMGQKDKGMKLETLKKGQLGR